MKSQDFMASSFLGANPLLSYLPPPISFAYGDLSKPCPHVEEPPKHANQHSCGLCASIEYTLLSIKKGASCPRFFLHQLATAPCWFVHLPLACLAQTQLQVIKPFSYPSKVHPWYLHTHTLACLLVTQFPCLELP